MTAEKGGATKDFNSIDDAKNCLFEGVRNPSKLEVFINGGKAENLELAEVVETGLAAPMYAAKTGAEFGEPVDEISNGKTVKTYKVTLNPQHETALVEFSCINMLTTKENLVPLRPLHWMVFSWITSKQQKVAAVLHMIPGMPHRMVFLLSKNSGEDFMTPGKVWPATVEQQAKCYAYNMFPVLAPAWYWLPAT